MIKAIDEKKRVEVKMLDGRLFGVEVDKETAIVQLKKLISKVNNIPANEQLLLYTNGRGGRI